MDLVWRLTPCPRALKTCYEAALNMVNELLGVERLKSREKAIDVHHNLPVPAVK
jgi:hypothetical protein